MLPMSQINQLITDNQISAEAKAELENSAVPLKIGLTYKRAFL